MSSPGVSTTDFGGARIAWADCAILMDAQRGEGRFAIRLGADSHLFEQLTNPIREQHPCTDARKLLDTLAELKIGDVGVVLAGGSQQLVVGKRNPGHERVRELDPRAIRDAIRPG
jgi:hypothetical protein